MFSFNKFGQSAPPRMSRACDLPKEWSIRGRTIFADGNEKVTVRISSRVRITTVALGIGCVTFRLCPSNILCYGLHETHLLMGGRTSRAR